MAYGADMTTVPQVSGKVGGVVWGMYLFLLRIGLASFGIVCHSSFAGGAFLDDLRLLFRPVSSGTLRVLSEGCNAFEFCRVVCVSLPGL